jgi:integrase
MQGDFPKLRGKRLIRFEIRASLGSANERFKEIPYINSLLRKAGFAARCLLKNVLQNVLQRGNEMSEKGQYLSARNRVWHYYRRVPIEYAHLDERHHIKLSTKIKVANDRTGTKAGRVAARMNETHEAYWRSLADNKAAGTKQAYTELVKLARSMGLDYMTPSAWAAKPITEVLARIETLLVDGRIEDPALRKAALGGIEKPKIMLSDLYNEYEATQKSALAKMSPDQLRKWKAAKKRAVEILIKQRGNKALQCLSRDDALAFADWWEDRVVNEGISAGTANKNITHIGGIFRAVNKRLQLGLDNVFAGTRIEGSRDGKRSPFSVDFIRNMILADDALGDLNGEARDVVYVVMETGARPSEIVNLSKARIRLDAEIPHILIAAEGRLLKTEHSERAVPLVGRAFEAMRRRPNGFPRCFDKGSNLSAAVMKHFRKHKLLPTAKHSLYSFRHSFKDRLKSVEAPEELIDEVMGHSTAKPKYGDGYGLKLKQKYIQAIAFTSTTAGSTGMAVSKAA